MRQREDDLSARDAAVFVVSFDPPRRTGGYCRRHRLPFVCLSDEQRVAYRAYGLGRASWLRTLTPRALAPYLTLYFRAPPPGRRSRLHYGGQDLRQMGGDFVVAPDGRLTLAYASHDPADRPSAEQILAAIG